MGDGGAGKTSLVKQLFGETFNKKESKTDGINIRDRKIETTEKDIFFHFWDFGGQEIMHATHQFFMSNRSLYILVLDGRKKKKWIKRCQGRKSLTINGLVSRYMIPTPYCYCGL